MSVNWASLCGFRTLKRLLGCSIALAATVIPALEAATPSFTLSTADTTIVVSAGQQVPTLLSLANPGGTPWRSRRSEVLIDRVELDGKWQPLRWHLASTHSDSQTLIAVYECPQPHLSLEWRWEARAREGPIEHRITIKNLESRPMTLPLQDSYDFEWTVPASIPLKAMWIDKGAGKPTAIGTHEAPIGYHYAWEGESSTYAEDGPDSSREVIPWMLVQRVGTDQQGWYLGVEFSGRTRLSLTREGSSLAGRSGLNSAPGDFLTRIEPGGSFTTPTVFLGAFAGGTDAAGAILRRWVARVLLNPVDQTNPTYPPLVENSWGEGMGINEQKARSMIADTAKLGLEMFHLDAGWFRGVGDWYSNLQKFPHGIAALADHAHGLGLKFGLWVDWTQAGTDTASGALNVHDPAIRDWLTRDVPAGWKTEDFKGVTLDIGDPPARAWCAQELDRLVNENHLDMLEFDGYLVAKGCVRSDHPHVSCAGSMLGPPPFLEGSCSTDVSYGATRSYYELYEGLRQKHPQLLLEACNDGGRMVDFGTAAHTDYFSITDTYDPVSNRRAFYDASHLLPAAMLECYVEKYPAKSLANFVYALRSGMMGWCTIMQDTTAWGSEQRATATRAFDTYKRRLRPLIRSADLYHISPRPDGVHWDALEYFAPEHGEGVVYVFRGTTPSESGHSFVLKGLRPDRQYKLHFEDRTSPDRTSPGRDLMNSGLAVSLAEPESSELVFVDETKNAGQGDPPSATSRSSAIKSSSTKTSPTFIARGSQP